MSKRRRERKGDGTNRGTKLSQELLGLVGDEMRRDRRSGSHIIRDALEQRYQAQLSSARDSYQPPWAQTPSEIVTISTPTVVKAHADHVRNRDDLGRDRAPDADGDGRDRARDRHDAGSADAPDGDVGGRDHVPRRDDVDRRRDPEPVKTLRIRVVSVGSRSAPYRRLEPGLQAELQRARSDLRQVELERRRALDERDRARETILSERATASKRGSALATALHRRPRLGRGARTGRPYVLVPTVDASGKTVWKARLLRGYRFRRPK